MITDRRFIVGVLLVSVLLAMYAFAWALPIVFEPLRARAVDHMFALRSAVGADPSYDDTIVMVTMDDPGTKLNEDFYLGRERHARLVRALSGARVAVQLHDLIFAAPLDEKNDNLLARETVEAGTVYYGMALGASECGTGGGDPPTVEPEVEELLEGFRWDAGIAGGAAGLAGISQPHLTFPLLARAARGLGFLDLTPDRDGVHRRVPLILHDSRGTFPSMSLLVAADFLGVDPSAIEIEPGRAVTLRGARYPGAPGTRDIAIPIDRCGRAIVNYLGDWHRLKNYPLSTISDVAGDRFAIEDLGEEIGGKIAVVSWLTTGSGDIGPVPMDPEFPLAAVHATVVNNILTGEFMRELSGWEMLVWFELPFLVLLYVAALRMGAVPFLSLATGLLVVYQILGFAVFIAPGLILDMPLPSLFLMFSAIVVSGYQYNEQTQARARLEREMAVAREIQISTLPSKMPSFEGYDAAGVSRPADETGGDTFDLIRLDDNRLVLLLGDATGHGLGPALSVTQVRSMLRIALRMGADLDAAYVAINDQLSDDLAANRFVTAFLGVLDRQTHSVTYHSGGQGPLMQFHAGSGEFEWRQSTAMPMGMLGGMPLKDTAVFEMQPGDVLGLMTDGIFEYENRAGEQFGEERVAALIAEHCDEPAARVVEILMDAVDVFAQGAPQADDMTIVLLRRLRADDGD